MKVVMGLVLVLVLGGLAIYYGGGYASFDPEKQGRDAKAAIAPGMPWTKVVNLAGEPRQYQVIIEQKQKSPFGGEMVQLKPGPLLAYNRDKLTARVSDSSLPNGFIFEYEFSATVAFYVLFDSVGNVVTVDDLVTLNTLLNPD